MPAKKFYVPLTSSLQTLASGRPLAPGEQIELTHDEQKDEFNKGLVEDGHIIELKDSEQKIDNRKKEEGEQ